MTSRGHWQKTCRIWGYYAYWQSGDDNSGPYGTNTNVCNEVRTLSNCPRDSLVTIEKGGSTVCIKYSYLRITVLHYTLWWRTRYSTRSYRGTSVTSSFPGRSDIPTTSMATMTIPWIYCHAYASFILSISQAGDAYNIQSISLWYIDLQWFGRRTWATCQVGYATSFGSWPVFGTRTMQIP